MPQIQISVEAERALRLAAQYPFQSSAVRLPNGLLGISVESETLARLRGLRQKGETLSDTILRLIAQSRNQIS